MRVCISNCLLFNDLKIAQVEYDRGRLEQELIYYIEKLDVNEEKQRLAQHLSYFIETLRHPAPGQGKKSLIYRIRSALIL